MAMRHAMQTIVPYRSEPACRCGVLVWDVWSRSGGIAAHLGENVVSENEYRSAMSRKRSTQRVDETGLRNFVGEYEELGPGSNVWLRCVGIE